MRYEDVLILMEYAKLQRKIAISRNPTAAMDVSEENITASSGYRRLRVFTASLPAPKRARFLAQLKAQIGGVRDVMALAAKTGERLSIGEVEIEVYDAETRAPIGPAAEHWQQNADDLREIRKQLEPNGTK